MKTPLEFSFNAALFTIAHLFVGKDQTRYYLHGVYVEPHPDKGVTLTATCGWRLISLYDSEGTISRPAILKLKGGLLSLTRLKASRAKESLTGTATEIPGLYLTKLGTSNGFARRYLTLHEIDGAFPDYRHTVPPVPAARCSYTTINHQVFAKFGKAASLINKAIGFRDWPAALTVTLGETTSHPILVRFPSDDRAFGLIMPMKESPAEEPPDWFAASEKPSSAQQAPAPSEGGAA